MFIQETKKYWEFKRCWYIVWKTLRNIETYWIRLLMFKWISIQFQCILSFKYRFDWWIVIFIKWNPYYGWPNYSVLPLVTETWIIMLYFIIIFKIVDCNNAVADSKKRTMNSIISFHCQKLFPMNLLPDFLNEKKD